MSTIIEKIFSMHSKDRVEVGETIWLDIDVRTARDFGGAQVVKNLLENYDGNYVENANKTFFTFDTSAPAKTIGYAQNQQICRKFARQQGIRVFDVDAGIGTHVLMEEGIIHAGVTAVGTDSHYNIVGAIGAFGQGMGDVDIAFVFKTGKTWFEVPPTIKVHFNGMPSAAWTAKDLALFTIKKLGRKALGKAIEFYGEIIDALSVDARITLASMVTEMGGIIGFIPPDDATIKWMEMATGKKVEPVYADKDASYDEEIDIDVSNLKPMIALPGSPSNVRAVEELPYTPIDTVFIGSCTNGRLEDMHMVAKIVKGKKIKDGVTMKVVPTTRRVWKSMLEDGTMKILADAGAIISNPGCGGCAAGQIGMTGEGEIQISTANRNFKGKQGLGETYLASPATAAASAIAGYITEVEND
ncbi:MAG: 3-isopropylmalate dehydratase large subunit [Thermoplasmata archaeon]|nr:3-isopropylmalate dehydratase large subunit [Thermoplasmata archaeon]